MDKKKSLLNVSISIVSKVLLLAAALYVRRLLIRYIGNEVNGLNSLYTNIIGVLAVAELGVGSAIVFSMYRPIVAGDQGKVAALYCLFKRLYLLIGFFIFCAGLAVMPFLPGLINDYHSISVNVYLTFFITLIAVALSYLYSAKSSLIEAYKDNYVTTAILTVAKLLCYGLQLAVILIWKSYVLYLLCQIIENVVVWCLTELAVRRLQGDIVALKERVDPSTKQEIVRNVKAMMMHKIGTVMVMTADSLIISGFIGVVILGKYTNYNFIATTMAGILALFFTPLTSVVGHLCAAADREETKKWFYHFYALNYLLGFVFFLGYYAVIDSVVSMLFGPDLEMSRAIVFIITLNQFTQYMRKTLLLFRNASGTFYNDRWKPVAEGMVNLILSLLFVRIFPEEYKVVGVIVATILTTLFICNTVEPYVVFKNVFGVSPKSFYFRHYGYTAVFAGSLILMTRIMRSFESPVTGLLANGFLAVGVALGVLGMITAADRMFRREVLGTAGKVCERAKRLINR